MPTLSLLYEHSFPINDRVSIVIPSVGEVLHDEDGYYSLVHLITAMPIDLMVQLDDMGVDFSKINEYDLFLYIVFPSLQQTDTTLLFGDLDLSKFEYATNEQTGMVVLIDRENDIVIDRPMYSKISAAVRKIHDLKKDTRTPGNEEARKYMLERARKKLARQKNKVTDSQLETLIVALVNTEQFKYDFDSVRSLTIYQFNESVQQVTKKIEYDNRMRGVYAGTIDVKSLSQDDLTWLTHKSN